MEQITVLEAQAFCLSNNIPFYAYRLPKCKKYYFGAQIKKDSCHFEWSRGFMNGFVMKPFEKSAESPGIYIRKEVCFSGETKRERLLQRLERGIREPGEVREVPLGISREEYHRQVTEMIRILKQGKIKKMVLSRGITVKCDAYHRLPHWFDELANRYPNAFVFVASVPGVTTWMGATPELFLRNRDFQVRTMALAGTRPAGSRGEWGAKELEEQAIVEDYIARILNKQCKWTTKGPFSKKAGQVEHLCTEFSAKCSTARTYLHWFANNLHPTPAVAGCPKEIAMKTIREIEGKERRYYGGFVGPIGLMDELDWFVNLRCMEVFPNAVHLHVGGGITAASDPDKEWEETELKAKTLLEVVGS